MASDISQISQVAPCRPPTAGFSSGGLFEVPAQASLPPTVPPSPIGSMMSQWPTEQVLPMSCPGGYVAAQPGVPGTQASVSPMPTAQVGMLEPLPAQNLQSQAPLSARQPGTGDFGMRPTTEQAQQGQAQSDGHGWLSWLFGRDSGNAEEMRQPEQYLVPRGAPPDMSAFPMPRSPREAAQMQSMQMQSMRMQQMERTHQQQLQEMQFMEQQRLEQQRQMEFEQMRQADHMRQMQQMQQMQHAQMAQVQQFAPYGASPCGWQDPYASGFGPTPIGYQGPPPGPGPGQYPSARPMPPTSFTGY